MAVAVGVNEGFWILGFCAAEAEVTAGPLRRRHRREHRVGAALLLDGFQGKLSQVNF